jgi:hypothetical protein
MWGIPFRAYVAMDWQIGQHLRQRLAHLAFQPSEARLPPATSGKENLE